MTGLYAHHNEETAAAGGIEAQHGGKLSALRPKEARGTIPRCDMLLFVTSRGFLAKSAKGKS